MDRARIEEAVRGHCVSREDIAAEYLHGSQARGTAHAASAVDLAVLYRDAPPSGLEAALERELGRCRVRSWQALGRTLGEPASRLVGRRRLVILLV
jgi:predicted nucleotidyltransferase